jgi:hypothetical protein
VFEGKGWWFGIGRKRYPAGRFARSHRTILKQELAFLERLCTDVSGLEKTEKVEAATGFEPVNGGFADQ